MKIFIQGFKSIRDGQYVALGRKLTFLVGPNSAGKSVVKLALDRLSGESPDFEVSESLIFKNPNVSNQIAGIHSLGLEWESNGKILSYITSYAFSGFSEKFNSSWGRNLNHPDNIHKTNHLISRDEAIDLSSEEYFAKMTGLYLSGNLQLGTARGCYSEGASFFGFNYSIEFVKKNFPKIYKNLDLDVNVFLGLTDDSIFIKNNINEIKKWLLSLEDFDESGSDWRNGDTFFAWNGLIVKNLVERVCKADEKSGKDRQVLLNLYEKYNATIDRRRNTIFKAFEKSYPGKNLITALVSADRGIPVAKDMECVVESRPASNSLSICINNFYYELMESAVSLKWGDCFGFDFDHNLQGQELIVNVNKALSESLFVDNGYQIEVNSKILASKNDWDLRLVDAVDFEETPPVFFCKMFLRDAHGRDLSFEEIGSGIGYVMPVLIESFRFSNANKVVFLQQPELHLHPALQANLTDVLIEASANKRIVAETHSEHMILRALKRVRQTTNKTLKDPNLALSPDDIAVNYFEPMPDGSTRVHILRVSEDGDFLDRWPNGFFAERDQELFDE